MPFDELEIGRLAIMIQYPRRYLGRRVEQVEHLGNDYLRVAVTQHVTLPAHNAVDRDEVQAYVSLGQISKTRHPDLVALGPRNERLAVPKRSDRGQLLSTIFTSKWSTIFFAGAASDSPVGRELKVTWSLIQRYIALVIIEPEPAAERRTLALRSELTTISRDGGVPVPVQQAVQRLIDSDEFWRELTSLARTTHLVAVMRGVPGESYEVVVRFSERLPFVQRGSYTLPGLILAKLGLSTTTVYRRVANRFNCESMYVIAETPPGLEPVRFFWQSAQTELPNPNDEVIECDRAVLASYSELPQGEASADYEANNEEVLSNYGSFLELQIEPSDAILAAIALSLFMLFVATYIFQRVPTLTAANSSVLGIAGIFSALPAAIAGGIAYRGAPFARRISRGPRLALTLLTALSALLAATISLRGLDRPFVEWLAYATSIYAVVIVGLFGYVQWGPRWRHNERTRRPNATRALSPLSCRRKQDRDATIFLIIWIAVVVVFARLQFALQHTRFFAHDFPWNMWHAFMNWF